MVHVRLAHPDQHLGKQVAEYGIIFHDEDAERLHRFTSSSRAALVSVAKVAHRSPLPPEGRHRMDTVIVALTGPNFYALGEPCELYPAHR